jgi:predicted phage terminase large subunit-like protein
MAISELNDKNLLIVLEAELCKRSLYEFFRMASKILYPSVEWDYNWHFKYIADILQAETERIVYKQKKDKDYIINLPFRSGKSILISIIYPVWVWLKDPALSIITVSATDALATKFSHTSKILIDSDWFQERFGIMFQIRTDQHAKGAFMNTSGGRRESFGINSGIIGSGCDIMLLDDIQSPDNVTPVGLKNTIESYTDVLYSRLNNPDVSVRICLQQRVHENDISGYLMRTNPDKYYHICIPAILSTDLHPKDLAVNYTNRLFWEKRFSQKVMDDFKSTMRPAPYAGQLLQRPVPEEGDLIKRSWFKSMKQSDVLALNLQWNLVLDTAFTDSTKNDPSGYLIVAKHNNSLIILKAGRKWLQFHELLEEIKELQRVYKINKIYIEEKASGISIFQELQRQTKYNVLKLSPKSKDKIQRVIAVQPVLQSQRVILVTDDSWNEMLLSECASFPFAVHDDLVDCLSYSVDEFLQKGGTTTFKSF